MVTYHECPTCGAEETSNYDSSPCRTPKGRKKIHPHDTRPFSIDFVLTGTMGGEEDEQE